MKRSFVRKALLCLLLAILIVSFSPLSIWASVSILCLVALCVKLPKTMLYTFLFCLAIIILVLFTPIGLMFTVIKAIEIEIKDARLGVHERGLRYAAMRMEDNALSLDIFGNVVLKDIMDWVFVKEVVGAIPFGNTRASVSGVIGLNKERGTLTIFGKALAAFLDFVDKNHCQMAANNNRQYFFR